MVSYTDREEDELENAIAGISPADLKVLKVMALSYAKKIEGVDADDLFHDTIVRALEGNRNWCKEISLRVFLVGVMRSIVSEEYRDGSKKATYKKMTTSLNEMEEGQGECFTDGETLEDKLLRYSDLSDRESLLDRVKDYFSEDEVIYELVAAKLDDLSPQQIVKTVFVGNKTRYESAMRKFRRKAKTLAEREL